jgi:hypothetical protein
MTRSAHKLHLSQLECASRVPAELLSVLVRERQSRPLQVGIHGGIKAREIRAGRRKPRVGLPSKSKPPVAEPSSNCVASLNTTAAIEVEVP